MTIRHRWVKQNSFIEIEACALEGNQVELVVNTNLGDDYPAEFNQQFLVSEEQSLVASVGRFARQKEFTRTL